VSKSNVQSTSKNTGPIAPEKSSSEYTQLNSSENQNRNSRGNDADNNPKEFGLPLDDWTAQKIFNIENESDMNT